MEYNLQCEMKIIYSVKWNNVYSMKQNTTCSV